MVYGGAVPALSDQITGFVNGQNSSVVTGTPTISTTASSTSTVAGGPYTITITAGTLSAPNYTFTTFDQRLLLTVNPAPLTVTANNASMVYGAAVPHSPTRSPASSTDRIPASSAVRRSSRPPPPPPAPWPAGPTRSRSPQARSRLQITVHFLRQWPSLTVNPAPLTVTANNVSMVYGAAVPALSDQITGFVNGQNSSVVTGTPIISTTASSTSTVAGGPYTITITAGTLSAANYTFTSFGNGSLPLTRRR